MTDFPFAKTQQSRDFCLRIKEALIKCCQKTEVEAILLINQYWKNRENLEDDPILHEEPAYYYAMCMAHHPVIGDNNVLWYKDPELWPPPERVAGYWIC